MQADSPASSLLTRFVTSLRAWVSLRLSLLRHSRYTLSRLTQSIRQAGCSRKSSYFVLSTVLSPVMRLSCDVRVLYDVWYSTARYSRTGHTIYVRTGARRKRRDREAGRAPTDRVMKTVTRRHEKFRGRNRPHQEWGLTEMARICMYAVKFDG